jgi:hypothetical protein
MIDLRRLRGTAIAMLGVVLAIGACRLAVPAMTGGWPRWLPKSDWTFTRSVSYRTAGERLAGIAREGIPAGARFGALLGSSTLHTGVDPTVLDSDVAPPLRWFHLNGNGTTGSVLDTMAGLLLRSRIRPEVVVFGVNLGMMAEDEGYVDSRLRDETGFHYPPLRQYLVEGKLKLLLAEAMENGVTAVGVTLNRALPGRNRISTNAQYLALRARMALFAALGVDTEAIFSPMDRPWEMDPGWTSGPHVTEEEMTGWMDVFRNFGWFKPEHYAAGNPHARSIANAVKRCRDSGIDAVIVLLPEMARVREKIPREAERCLSSALAEAFGPDGVDVIDLRDSLPDDLFFDPIHPDPEGKVLISRRLAGILKARLESRTARLRGDPGSPGGPPGRVSSRARLPARTPTGRAPHPDPR